MQIINGPNRPYSIAQIRVLHTGSFHSFSTLLTFTCGLSSLVNGFQPICWLFMLAKQNTCFSKLRAVISMLEKLLIGGKSISRIGEDFKEKSFKFLGHHIDENLTWVHHMDHVNKKLVSANYALSRSKSFLPRRILKNIYRSLFESHLHFGSIFT